ncbi:MAG: undecaprenyl/decaprenyl-phosphate alpha-N-acetylglucosaminyl 1-phosphate transferase, partial [Candidatus Hydrogenedentes bacterium]|nr:undecaprenyl/decaprenyl-phosphate alpha-N-acetylglucosaminyl 1-phosphate transferase [Candidatus Hydrogenedentota bacterium]
MKPPLLYLLVALGSFMIVWILVPLFRKLALYLEVVDAPTSARKIHSRAIPYLGGLPFFLAFLAVIIGLDIFAPRYAALEFYPMALAGFFIVLLGIYDDVCDLSSKIKLPLELLLCGALYYFGFGSTIIMRPLGGSLYIGGFAIIITALWIAGVMNAVNFTDGLDGLAAGLVCIGSLSLFAIAFQGNRVFSCILMAFLAGSTIAFLCYNIHPASVFMGDAGALFLGFIFGASTLLEQQKGVAVIALTIPMIVLTIPILDTVLSFLRRIGRASQGGFFEPDRNHLHHRLLALGLTQRQAVLALYLLSAFMGVLAFFLSGV